MKHTLFFLIILSFFSCTQNEHDLTVTGTVKGLKKGTIYLQRLSDTALIALDSVNILGDSSFELNSELLTPEMYYLYLDKNDKSENRISFFADKGITIINTSLKNFVNDAKIKGSKQQVILTEFNKMIKQFNNKSLDLIKAKFDAQKALNNIAVDSLQDVIERYDKSRFKYALNFTMNHLDSEVAPYIVLSELYNANIKALDTVYNNLDKKVLESKYGIELKKYIETIKQKN